MKSLISRDSHRPDKRYSGVHHVQGGMVTDADLDERSRITQDRTDNLGSDSINDGVPLKGGAVTRSEEDGSLSLGEGVIYADGVRGYLAPQDGADVGTPLGLFSKQADFPESPALPNNGDHIIYADIWERLVHPLEDPYLADVGLHGAVTSLRTRTMTQLKAAPLEARDEIDKVTGAFTKIGTAELTIEELGAEILANDCDPCAEVVSAERTIANALWRLEVIDVSGTPEAPGTITLAWSIENAAHITTANGPHDHFVRAGKVYEFFSEITESHLGVFATASDAKRSAFVDDLSTTPTPAKDHNGNDWPFVRRWDGRAVVNTDTATVTSSLGGGFQVSMDSQSRTVTLQVDAFTATLHLEKELKKAVIVAGDYWLVELRRFAPEGERIYLRQKAPLGVLHHYCTLFGVDATGAILEPTDEERRKLSFPVLSDLPASHVRFENDCEKKEFYGDAKNVQEALHRLCDISATDIGFTPNCDKLYDESKNVQDALDALCKTDFSIRDSFRLLFDWGVLCGLVPSLDKLKTGRVKISPGDFMDRSGKIAKFKGGTFDLNSPELNENIRFDDPDKLQAALKNGEACLALAAPEGGDVSVYVVPSDLAFAPDDPGFQESTRACAKNTPGPKIQDLIIKFPKAERLVVNKMLITLASGGALSGSTKLTEAEAIHATAVNEKLFREFEKVASKDEVDTLKARAKQAKQDHQPENSRGEARKVVHMQRETEVLSAYLISDDERRRRCVCRAAFPTCPPELGPKPYFVPIACLRGANDKKQLFLSEVCPFCCRKQAMTWRAAEYFIRERRDQFMKRFSTQCCAQKGKDDSPPKPPPVRDPGYYERFDLKDIWRDPPEEDPFGGFKPRPPKGDPMKVSVNDLSKLEAIKALTGHGIEIAETIDVNDEKALEIVGAKSEGVTVTDQLFSAGFVQPGDKVGLLVQDGVARGYMLLERGSGKPPFPTEPGVAISGPDALKVTELVKATKEAEDRFRDLAGVRESLSSDVANLKLEVEALGLERDKSLNAVKDITTQLSELANARAEITKGIETANKEFASAVEAHKTALDTLRGSQPVTVVAGIEDAAVIAGLASEGITTVSELSKLTPAKVNRLVTAKVIKNKTAAGRLKNSAKSFLNK